MLHQTGSIPIYQSATRSNLVNMRQDHVGPSQEMSPAEGPSRFQAPGT